MKNIYFIGLALIVMLYIIHEIRKGKFSIKESFWWVIASIIMLILAIFPYSIDHIAKFLNIDYPPSLLFVICIIFLLFINFKSSKKYQNIKKRLLNLLSMLLCWKVKYLIEKEISNMKIFLTLIYIF